AGIRGDDLEAADAGDVDRLADLAIPLGLDGERPDLQLDDLLLRGRAGAAGRECEHAQRHQESSHRDLLHHASVAMPRRAGPAKRRPALEGFCVWPGDIGRNRLTCPPRTPDYARVAVEAHRVLVVEDHPIFRDGLVQLLDAEPDFTVVGTSDGTAFD